jgi:hypothetical protein
MGRRPEEWVGDQKEDASPGNVFQKSRLISIVIEGYDPPGASR